LLVSTTIEKKLKGADAIKKKSRWGKLMENKPTLIITIKLQIKCRCMQSPGASSKKPLYHLSMAGVSAGDNLFYFYNPTTVAFGKE
jgi:hypothetical protein